MALILLCIFADSDFLLQKKRKNENMYMRLVGFVGSKRGEDAELRCDVFTDVTVDLLNFSW